MNLGQFNQNFNSNTQHLTRKLEKYNKKNETVRHCWLNLIKFNQLIYFIYESDGVKEINLI